MGLEFVERPAKEGSDLFPEHAETHQQSCEGSDDSLDNNAASSRVDVEMDSSRQAQKEHRRNKRRDHWGPELLHVFPTSK